MHFWTLVDKRRKKLLCILDLCVKFQCWGTNIVEMRAKTVWRVKNHWFSPIFFTSFIFDWKTPKFLRFFGHPLRVVLHKKIPELMIEKKRYSTTNSVQYSGLHKAQSALENRKAPCTLQWEVHPGWDLPYVYPIN